MREPESRIEVQLLGALAVRVGGLPVPLPKSRKARALLVLLVLEPAAHARESLCEWLWSDANDPRAALRWTLSRLRDALGADGDPFLADRASVGVDTTRVSSDLQRLERWFADGIERVASADLLGLAAGIAHPPLATVGADRTGPYSLWLDSARQRIHEVHVRLLTELINRFAEEPDMALPLARQAAILEPFDDAVNGAVLRLTWASQGRRAAQAVLDRVRARYRGDDLNDSGLLRGWRALGGPGRDTGGVPDADAGPSALALPAKPSVALLGFEDLGGHPGGTLFAEGLAVDLNSRLSRLPGLFVIARESARRFSVREQAVTEIGTRLGVRYLIHGDTRRLDERVRVTANLLDAAANSVIWSERFDRPLDDVFLVQDDIADAITSAVLPEIERAEMDRARNKNPDNLDAWECYHRAMWYHFRFTARDSAEAERLLERALELDPLFARAHAGLSFNYFLAAFLDAGGDPQAHARKALEHAEESVSLDGRDAMSHWSLGRALFLLRQHDEALRAIDRALIANPNYAQGRYARGFVAVHSGCADQARPDLDLAQRLSPFDPLLFAMKSCRGISLALEGNHDAAARWLVEATQEPNAHFHIHALAGAALQLAGRPDEARAAVARAVRMHPGYSVAVFERSFPYQPPEHAQLFRTALAAAGLPPR